MSESTDEKILQKIWSNYSARPGKFTRLTSGLIHATYRVESEDDLFILQKLHPELSSDQLMADYQAITEHLVSVGFAGPKLIRTLDGRILVDEAGARYRVISYLKGKTFAAVEDARMAREAAKILGAFHKATANFSYRFTAGRPLHDSPKHFELFESTLREHREHEMRDRAEDLVRTVRDHLPRHFLPEGLPARVVHGDPKISNVLFDESSGAAVALVDLDSCSRHTVLVDIADATRSWCREGPEDHSSPALLDRFQALCEGYRESGSALEEPERRLIVQSVRLITMELASRFLRDVFENRYFGWDETKFPSRREHNLARARGCVVLFESMMEHRAAMEDVVRKTFG